ncbi:MAG: hypothetical protein GXP29_01950 [Planctomycetes bacterium]|nr:hypothetical protein [Planctomycetota bacterium]
MILQLNEIQPEDRRHLHSTDPRIADEVAAINRSIERLDESIPTWAYVAPKLTTTKKEVTV